MEKKTPKKLTLAKETITTLNDDELDQAAGGTTPSSPGCIGVSVAVSWAWCPTHHTCPTHKCGTFLFFC